MTNIVLRRIACLAAMLGLGMASFPSAQAAPVATAVTSIGHATAATSTIAAPGAAQAGKGWGAIISCAGCAIAAGIVVAGGPASILIAVNTPGSSIALLACAGACYEALAK
jgi:hypothetical protein